MMGYPFPTVGMFEVFSALSWSVLVIIMFWELIWKGIALWKCGRNDQPVWFVFILIVNSLGILPIVYLLFFQKKKKHKK